MPLSVAQPPIDETEADRRIAANRHDAAALAAKGDHRLTAGDRRGANAWYAAALRSAGNTPAFSAQEVARLESQVAALARYFTEHTLDVLADAGFPKSAWHPRFARAMAIMHGESPRAPSHERFPQLPNTFFYPGLPYRRFADPRDWGWSAAIEAATAAIRAEGEGLLRAGEGFGPYVRRTSHRPQGDVHGLIDNSDWQTLEMTQMGRPVAERVALAPNSFATISGHAPLCDIPNRAPTVMFSLLGAGKRIPPHTGMVNTRFICHLPLIVPGDGALRVGEEVRRWHEGQLLAFDDTIEHEAWNNARSDRLVLIFDVWRAELETVERDQIRTLFAAVDSA